MGMSASQARMLSLTARLSDKEFQAQNISNSKTRLATKSEEVTKTYSDALNQKKISLLTGFSNSTPVYQDLSFDLLTGPTPGVAGSYCLSDTQNRVLVRKDIATNFSQSANATAFATLCLGTNDPNADTTYYVNLFHRMQKGYTTEPNENQTINNKDWLENQLKEGGLFVEKYDKVKDAWADDSWQSNSEIIQQNDDTDVAIIKAQYDVDLGEINNKDKKFDLELKAIDTEHSAIQTEMESVKKVIDKNIENSFKTFG